jgi:hypothetical protein
LPAFSLGCSGSTDAAGAFDRASQADSGRTDLRAAGSRITEQTRLVIGRAGDGRASAFGAKLAIATISVRLANAALAAAAVLLAAANCSGRPSDGRGERDLLIAGNDLRHRESRERREQSTAGAAIRQDFGQRVETVSVHPSPSLARARTTAIVDRQLIAGSGRRGTRSSKRRRVVGGDASPPGDLLH